MDKNLSLKIIKPNIFKKIFDFIGHIFKRSKTEKITNNNNTDGNNNVVFEESKENSKAKFMNTIKIQKKEKNDIELLQEQFESNKISLKQLTNKQIFELNLLYEKQIEEIRRNVIIEKKRLEQLNN